MISYAGVYARAHLLAKSENSTDTADPYAQKLLISFYPIFVDNYKRLHDDRLADGGIWY